MNDKLLDSIKTFTEKQAGRNANNITESASLEKDLGIYGEDAVEYIIAFGKAFNVDVSKFMAADYFSPEGDFILPAIIRLITGKKKLEKKQLTIQHLMKAIEAGKLDEEVINS